MDKLCLLLDFANIPFEASMDFVSQIERFEEAYNLTSSQIAEVFQGNNKRAEKFIKAKEELEDYLIELKEKEIKYVKFFDENYPKKLKKISDPPFILYYKGNLSIAENFGIGIIGSRKPTVYGSYVAKNLTEKLVDAGITIISGMASGIDGIAHKAAIDSKGETIAVMGTGFDQIYPSTNKKLYTDILENNGLVVSENHHKKITIPPMFMFRNRIISGLGEGLLVVEAGIKSGTMTTVDFGLNQGKSIFAVPGNINSPLSQGTNGLIKNGAVMVNSSQDILNEFPNSQFLQKTANCKTHNLSDTEAKVVLLLKEKGTLHMETLAYIANINIKDLSGVLNILEIKGIVSELGNKLYTYIE